MLPWDVWILRQWRTGTRLPGVTTDRKVHYGARLDVSGKIQRPEPPSPLKSSYIPGTRLLAGWQGGESLTEEKDGPEAMLNRQDVTQKRASQSNQKPAPALRLPGNRLLTACTRACSKQAAQLQDRSICFPSSEHAGGRAI